MNNRRNLKENLTISNKQRFSIRKFSIGVASVMLGTTLYFMGGVGTSIVHADSVQGQSVQTSNLDTNSAQASSDTSSAEQTSSQNQTSSAQNSQKAVSNASSNTESTDSKTQTSDQVDNATTDKNEASQADNATTDKNEASQADNASATNIKTRDNKKVVSDANRAKSTANDAQTKPAQQTAKSDAANSNTLVVQRTKKLTVNAKLLADSKAQTDTKTDSKYSVTDNYPEGLMNYLPRDFNNTQEYAFEWLRNERKNNIILTTNRTGDGVVHVYQDGKEVDTLARNSLYPLPLYDNIWGDEIGTVYNDDYAGIVQSNGLNIIYSSHAKDVDNAGSSYSTVSFFVPRKIKQTVTYYDSKGNVIDSLTHTQYGLTGQSYTTGLPSGSDYVRKGEYLVNTTHNGSGLMSEFYDTYSCTKDYHDGVKVTFTENDSDGIGAMDYVIYDGGWVAQWGSLAYGQSTNYTNDSGIYTIVNPYVPQTTNIVYQYKKLGQVITTDPSGNKTGVYYANDQSDPTKIEPVNAKPITGYSAIVKYENKIVSDKNFMPTNLGENTYITYSAHAQKASVTYVDDKTGKTLKVDNLKGVTNAKSGYTTKAAIDTYTGLGYTLVSDDTNGKEVVFDNDDAVDQAFTVHLSHGTITVTTENPGKPGEPINPGEGSANYPDGTDKAGLTDTVNRTITYVMSDGSKAPDAVHDSLSYTASKVIDKVTGEVISTEWSKNQDFKDVVSPDVTGYTPDVKTVSNKNVAHDAKDIDVVVTYKAHAQKASVTYVDDKTGKTLKVDNLKGVTNAKSGYTTKAAIDTYTGLGYTLVSDDTNGKEVVFDNDDAVDQAFTVHLSHGTITVTTENPGKPGEPVDPDNPDGPKYPDGTDEYQVKRTGTQTIHYVGAGDKTPADNKQTFVFTREITFDEVTGKIISVTPWNVQSHTFGNVDTPVIPGYHADKAVAGGATVTPDDLNKVITVTYAPDGGSGDNPGSNGGGDQGTTPTPDDQPDTTLPSDNNTDKDVEKDKQDKPKKVKKARKIIKTRITKQEHIGNAEKAEPLAEQEHNDQTVASPVKNEANEPQLPQTGEANTSVIGLLGMLVAGFAAILGFESSRSRKHKN